VDSKRFKEWLGTVQGVAATAASSLPLITSLSDKVRHWLNDILAHLDIPAPWGARLVSALIAITWGLLFWRSLKGFAQASRLEQPDAFTLRPTTPSTLIGRTEDLAKLINAVKQHRLVLLDGESGCGKTALINAGLIPTLQQAGSLLPVAIREWSDDWVRGPLADALDATYHALSPGEREKLGWTAQPDLTAAADVLAADLEARLAAVFPVLGRRVLLIVDQFDDYQARHRGRFLDGDGNWLTPTALAAANPFWGLVSAGLHARAEHLLVVTRADTAAGMSCVRFLGEDMTATRSLARVEADYLHPLLVGITADDHGAEVVSHPEGGWEELRDCIERDLKKQGAILMQQVRTVMLGLRQLPLLTPRHYHTAGGLHGVETLFIARALQRAGNAVGGADGRRIAGAVLGALVLPGGPSQPPKARRASLSQLSGIVGDVARTEAVLGILQHEEVVRPAETPGTEGAWQLDHDYLTRAVLAQAQQANRWAIALREGKAHYEAMAGNWRDRYAALLPFTTLMRLCWERARNRLKFGKAADYALASAIKPTAVVLCLMLAGTGTYTWLHNRQLTLEAYQLINRFAANDSQQAVLQTWRAPEALRRRILDLLRTDAGQLQLAVNAGWHRAHAGSDPSRAREVTRVLSEQLAKEQRSDAMYNLTQAYKEMLARLDDPAEARAEAVTLRVRVERERNKDLVGSLVDAYTAAILQSNDGSTISTDASILRARLEQEPDPTIADNLEQAYKVVVARLNEAKGVKREAAALRSQLAQPRRDGITGILLRAYQAAASRLSAAPDVKAEAAALRALLVQEANGSNANMLAAAYAPLAARLEDQAEIRAAATALRARLEHTSDRALAAALAEAYTAVTARLDDAAEIHAAVAALRERLGHASNDPVADAVAQAYAATAARLRDAAGLADAVVFLRTRMLQGEVHNVSSEISQGMSPEERADVLGGFNRFANLVRDYKAVLAHLNDPAAARAEANALRGLLEQEYDTGVIASLSAAYETAVGRLDAAALKDEAAALREKLGKSRKDPRFSVGAPLTDFYRPAYKMVAARLQLAADVKTEAAGLRERLEQEQDIGVAMDLADAYEVVAANLSEAADVKDEVQALRARLERQPEGRIADSFQKAYMAAAQRMHTAADIRAEAETLRRLLTEARYEGIYAFNVNYEALTKRLSNAADVRAEVVALRLMLEQEWKGQNAETCRRVYASLVARLNDPAEVQAAAASLRLRLLQPQDADNSSSIAQDYTTVMVRLNDADAIRDAVAVIRSRMEKNPAAAGEFYSAYGTLAARLDEANEVKAAAVFLRARLQQELGGGSATNVNASLAQAYTAVATRLRNTADVKTETAALRNMLLQVASEDMAQVYIPVAVRLHAMADLDTEAKALRSRLERAQHDYEALPLARAYAAVAGAMVKRADGAPAPALVSNILALAGHPFLRQPEPLLRTLAPAARTDFGNNLRSAVRWAVQRYGVRPERLRPPFSD
jgi:flagellin-specific chaperone FliS